MKRKTKWLAAAAAATAIAAGGTGIASATAAVGGDDTEAPITGTALDKASAAALASTGGGRVTDTEVGDEESYYEVEISFDGGGQVDVQLDKTFEVVGSSADRNEDEGKDSGE